MRRLVATFFIIALLFSPMGCKPSPRAATSLSTTFKQTVVKIYAADAKTRKTLPASAWNLGPLVQDKRTIYPQNNLLKVDKDTQVFRFIAPDELGSYDTTITASGYFPKPYKVKVVAPDASLKVELDPIPPQTSEEAAFSELKANYKYDLPIYKPAYMPEGFTVAPYVIARLDDGTYKDKNPLYYDSTSEIMIAYSDGTRQITLKYAIRGDAGMDSGTTLDGRTVYITSGKDGNAILWYDEGYLYSVGGPATKDELIKIYRGLARIK